MCVVPDAKRASRPASHCEPAIPACSTTLPHRAISVCTKTRRLGTEGVSTGSKPILKAYSLISGCTMKSLISVRSEEHTSELQSRGHLVCRLLLENKNITDMLSETPYDSICTKQRLNLVYITSITY